jgi:hypothetical protein
MNESDSDRRAPSTVDLVAGLIGDAKDLAVAHLDGLRLEIREELTDLKASTKFAAAAAATFAVAALLASFGLVQAVWLYTTLPSWAAYLIIAAVFAVAGVIALMLRRRRSGDIDLIPEASLAKLKRDARWFTRRSRDVVT